MLRDVLNRIADGESLTTAEAKELMCEMMDEELTPIQMAGVLMALRTKGETANEIAGFAITMRNRARHIDTGSTVADTCGTGGDNSGTFNISTAAALIVAACGQPVAKHGNRGASSRCGSADVLEALGVDVALPPVGVERCVREAGIGFLFAPAFHPAMKFAALPRKELGVRTVFNLLGPLTNPAHPHYQLLGVSSVRLLDLMANALSQMGVERALVVHSLDGTDEISVAGPTSVREVSAAGVRAYEIGPEDFGVPVSSMEEIKGGDPETNAAIVISVFRGERGATRDAAVVNAAAGLYVSGRAPTLREGAELAGQAIDSGAALRTLERMGQVSRQARAEVAA